MITSLTVYPGAVAVAITTMITTRTTTLGQPCASVLYMRTLRCPFSRHHRRGN